MENTINKAIKESDEIVKKMEDKSKCKTCQNNKLTTSQLWMIVLSVFILVTSIYGTIQLVKDIASFFK